MILERVWEVLENGEWESRQALREASGVEYHILDRIINFLVRWNFVDIERVPELLVRRKAGMISPVEAFNVLRVTAVSSPVPSGRHRLAERVACRICGARSFNFTSRNQVECIQCHEKQWFTLETNKPLIEQK
jgi:hypothetical protein